MFLLLGFGKRGKCLAPLVVKKDPEQGQSILKRLVRDGDRDRDSDDEELCFMVCGSW